MPKTTPGTLKDGNTATFSSGEHGGAIKSTEAVTVINNPAGEQSVVTNTPVKAMMSSPSSALDGDMMPFLSWLPLVPGRMPKLMPLQEYMPYLPIAFAALGAVIATNNVRSRMAENEE